MKDYIMFMYRDALDQTAASDPEQWGRYIGGLQESGQFEGGSSISAGERIRQGQANTAVVDDLSGFIRVRAENAESARALLAGNPVYEAGGTVVIRELPRT